MFYRDKTPDKTRPASFSNGFKNIPGKGCVNKVHNSYAFVNVGNFMIREKYCILMRTVLSADKTLHTNEECFIS